MSRIRIVGVATAAIAIVALLLTWQHRSAPQVPAPQAAAPAALASSAARARWMAAFRNSHAAPPEQADDRAQGYVGCFDDVVDPCPVPLRVKRSAADTSFTIEPLATAGTQRQYLGASLAVPMCGEPALLVRFGLNDTGFLSTRVSLSVHEAGQLVFDAPARIEDRIVHGAHGGAVMKQALLIADQPMQAKLQQASGRQVTLRLHGAGSDDPLPPAEAQAFKTTIHQLVAASQRIRGRTQAVDTTGCAP